MEEELEDIIVPPSPSTTTITSTLGTSFNFVSLIEYDDLILKMGKMAINIIL